MSKLTGAQKVTIRKNILQSNGKYYCECFFPGIKKDLWERFVGDIMDFIVKDVKSFLDKDNISSANKMLEAFMFLVTYFENVSYETIDLLNEINVTYNKKVEEGLEPDIKFGQNLELILNSSEYKGDKPEYTNLIKESVEVSESLIDKAKEIDRLILDIENRQQLGYDLSTVILKNALNYDDLKNEYLTICSEFDELKEILENIIDNKQFKGDIDFIKNIYDKLIIIKERIALNHQQLSNYYNIYEEELKSRMQVINSSLSQVIEMIESLDKRISLLDNSILEENNDLNSICNEIAKKKEEILTIKKKINAKKRNKSGYILASDYDTYIEFINKTSLYIGEVQGNIDILEEQKKIEMERKGYITLLTYISNIQNSYKQLIILKEQLEKLMIDNDDELAMLFASIDDVSMKINELLQLASNPDMLRGLDVSKLELLDKRVQNVIKESIEFLGSAYKKIKSSNIQVSVDIEKENEIIDKIINYLIDNTNGKYNVSAEEILDYLNQDGNYEFNLNDIYNYLKIIKSRGISCESRSEILPKRYCISKPYVLSNSFYRVGKKAEDILLVSDLHVREGAYALDNLNKIYDYAVRNNIELILNLGDFIDSNNFNDSIITKQQQDELLSLLETIIMQMPDDIPHGILGGNHERWILGRGIDPIGYLSESRKDIIGLGYDSAILSFGDKSLIGIHHKKFEGVSDILTDSEKIQGVYTYLNNMYCSKNIDLRVCDIFGHFHKFNFDSSTNIISLPSFSRREGYNCKAVHIKLVYDNDEIIGAYFSGLSTYRNGFIRTGEMYFEKSNHANSKVLSKKC